MKGQVIRTKGSSNGQVRVVGAVPTGGTLTGTAAKAVTKQQQGRVALDKAVSKAK